MYKSETLTIDDSILDAVRETAQAAPRTMQIFVEKTVANDLRKEVKERLGDDPGPVHYPIEWASEKQRRAYFATDGFGKGIPYTRTGKLAANWDVVVNLTLQGGTITAGNDAEAAQFVYGPRQQPFHRNTGWEDADVVLLEELERAENNLIAGWLSIADPLEQGAKYL